MKLAKFLFLSIISLFLISFNLQHTIALKLELPSLLSNEVVTQHLGYSTSYNHAHYQPNWVAYTLSHNKLNGEAERTNDFQVDPNINPETANTKDYTKSGFDRGHLAPAADMSWSPQAMKESFYMSNISPQAPKFNRGIWKKLEEQVRFWAHEKPTLFIITGPILNEHLTKKIGKSHSISVPDLFFKAIADTSHLGKGIAFIMKNEGSLLPLNQFVVTIDSLEKVLHRDLFHQIPLKKQLSIEKKSDLNYWKFKN